MNTLHLQNLVQGCYGRRISYTDVDEITEDNIVSVVGSCIGDFNWNKSIFKYLWNYYKGDQPIRYRTKTVRDDIVNYIVENHAYEIVQFKTGQTYGEPVQYISRKDDEKINKAVDVLNDYMVDADKQSKDIKAGEWQSATGTSFKAVQIAENSDLPFRIVSPSPMNTFVIYSRSTEEPLLAVQELKDENKEWYKLCFSKNKQFIIKNGKVIDSKLHAFGDIPIIEYPNNHERISDIELVIDILDAINNMQSNRMDSIEQFVQSWVKFVNCDIDEETFAKMKLMGALVVKSNNNENRADVDIMSQELNQTESQVAKDDLWDNALSILSIPNRESQNSGGDTQGAVSLRAGWDFSKTRAKLKDPLVKAGDKKLAKIVLNLLRISGDDLGITTRDFEAQINHSPLDNLYTKAQALTVLLQAGVNPQVAISTCGLWGDAEKVFILSKPYLDNIYKTIDMGEKWEVKEQSKELVEQFNNQQNNATAE